MKKSIFLISAALTCATAPICHAAADKTVTAVADCGTLTGDSATNTVNVDMTFRVPEHYLPTRSRLFITPTLYSGDSIVREYTPMVLDGNIYAKKLNRKKVLENYKDPYAAQVIYTGDNAKALTIPYKHSFEIPAETDGQLIGVVSTDGCGVCTGVGAVKMADVISYRAPKGPKPLDLQWIEPTFTIRSKTASGKGVANLQFIVNKYDINLGLGNNRAELDNMVATLGPVLGDSLATLTSLSIYGMASADGSLPYNTQLSRNRANAARSWLVKELGIPAKVQKVITIGSRPEGWQPVLDAMVADNHPGAADIRAILDKYQGMSDDVAERYIRRTRWWNDIKDKYLQKDRKVEYTYTYTIKSFTDQAELLDMYKKRPDAFNEDEFLHVSKLAADDPSRIAVYETMLRYFPDNKTARNNLAYLYQKAGDILKARQIMGVDTPEGGDR